METNKTFEFFIDEKVTSWYRTRFEVRANNQEEAIVKAIEATEDGAHCVGSWELIHETLESMSIGENKEYATAELYSSNAEDDKIWDNKHGLLLEF
jgi:hypothetical protein